MYEVRKHRDRYSYNFAPKPIRLNESYEMYLARGGSVNSTCQARIGEQWSPKDKEQLLELCRHGATPLELAEAFPYRTWRRIKTMAHQLCGPELTFPRHVEINVRETFRAYCERVGQHKGEVSNMGMSRDTAWSLVQDWTQAPHLIRHMLAVEASMRAYAERFSEDVEAWGLAGLLHDFDYEKHGMDGHVTKGVPILREKGVPEDVLRTINAHYESATGVSPETRMDKTLMAVDELTGFITAVTLVRPSKQIADVEVSSVRKKWKAKEFAAAVDRAEIEHYAQEIGVTLDEHIGVVLNAMKGIASEIGL
jgi:putative nucleotidyltransferase with HDIG domain